MPRDDCTRSCLDDRAERKVRLNLSESPCLFGVEQLYSIFSSLPEGSVQWALADGEKVLAASPLAGVELGLAQGQPVGDHPWVRKVFQTKEVLTWSCEVPRGELVFSQTVIGMPMVDAVGANTRVLVYTFTCHPEVINPAYVFDLVSEIDAQQDLHTALAIFIGRCPDVFKATMAGIWLWQNERYQYMLGSSDAEGREELLRTSEVPAALRALMAKNANACGALLLSVVDSTPDGTSVPEQLTAWRARLREAGVASILAFPLKHLGEDLGLLILLASNPWAFDGASVLWLSHMVPLVASLVSEERLRRLADEREQDLNLLIWGTEILVQAESEDQLLTEAGEMAMGLDLQAGFFYLHNENCWEVCAPFGRLKMKSDGWEQWVFDQIGIERGTSYEPHKASTLCMLEPNHPELAYSFPWRRILIQPIETHRGIIGELWLMDLPENRIERRQEIFAALARNLGVALETIRQRRQLERLAATDALTGVLNRQGFERRINEEMAGTLRRGSKFLLLNLDLDGFKKLNDTQGHPAGDHALRTLARELRNAVREEDIVARTGGDEFTLVLTELGKGPEALTAIERIRDSLSLARFGIGVSIGVAEFPAEAADYEELYRLADQRLYDGKRSGKGRIVMGATS